MKNIVLDKLVSLGTIAGYDYENVDNEGNEGRVSDDRNSERLYLYFKDGQKLVLDTVCSGSNENTELIISE
jgi:hypothetical protein